MDLMYVDIPQLDWIGAHHAEVELRAAIDEALAKLPLHLERAVRDAFDLVQNPRLEDVRAGDLEEAIRTLSRPEIAEPLREFLSE